MPLTQPLPIFSPNLSQDIIKIAIQCEGKMPLLYEFSQKKALSIIIKEICAHWNVIDPFNHGLQFLDHSLYIFVHEKNRCEIKNGAILMLHTHLDIIVDNIGSLLEDYQNNYKSLSLATNSLNKGATSGSLANKLGFTNYYQAFNNSNILIDPNATKICGDITNPHELLENFAKYCSDPHFAQYFVDKKGLDKLLLTIQLVDFDKLTREKPTVLSTTSGTLIQMDNQEILTFMLLALDELIQNNLIDWESDYKDIMLKIISYLKLNNINLKLLKPILLILEAIISNWYRGFGIFVGEVNISEIIPFLKMDDAHIQIASLTLLNSVLNKAIEMGDIYNMVEQLNLSNICDVVTKNLFKNDNILKADLLQHLKQLQHYLFIPIEREINVAFDENNYEHVQLLQSFGPLGISVINFFGTANPSQTLHQNINLLARMSAGLESEGGDTQGNNGKNGKGRSTPSTPSPSSNSTFDIKEYESEILPLLSQRGGYSALKSLKFFATNYSHTFAQVLNEHQSRTSVVGTGLSMYQIALHITLTLSEILKISQLEMGNDEPGQFYLMFYSVALPYYELFVIAFSLFLKTWKEMRASTSHDFIKVFTVVREQITRALDMNPVTFEKFKQDLNSLCYPNLAQIWQRERYYKEELESQTPSIMELREHIKPRIVKIIAEHRMNFMKKGNMFTKQISTSTKSHRMKEKLWQCKLSSNHKIIWYGFASDDTPIYSTANESGTRGRINISDIGSIKCGKDVSQSKEMKSKRLCQSLFLTLIPKGEGEEALRFIAPDYHTFCMWSDGLNILLGNETRSQEFKNDLETILSMEIKIALLELDTVSIPELPLSIPDDPPDFNFVDPL